jgi:hypothetical protein
MLAIKQELENVGEVLQKPLITFYSTRPIISNSNNEAAAPN